MVSTAPSPDLVLHSADDTWTLERWERLPDDGNRYEVIDGVLYRSTVPGFFHQWVLFEAYTALREQLFLPGIAFVVAAPMGVLMPGCAPVQPDIVVIRQEDHQIINGRIYGVPALLVEVLSPSNADYDLTTKRSVYARAGVPEYWVFRPAQRDVLVHAEPDPASGHYLQVRRIAPDGELVAVTLPFRAPIASFFAGAPDTTL
jgi:Uma2 family endonuclease